MTKLTAIFALLAPILAALLSVVFVLSTPTLAAGIVQYGFCYSNGDCTSNDAITVQGPDSTTSVDLLNGYYKYCASFRGNPKPAANIYVCESGCNTNCTKINSGCDHPQTAKRFSCAYRTNRAEDEE